MQLSALAGRDYRHGKPVFYLGEAKATGFRTKASKPRVCGDRCHLSPTHQKRKELKPHAPPHATTTTAYFIPSFQSTKPKSKQVSIQTDPIHTQFAITRSDSKGKGPRKHKSKLRFRKKLDVKRFIHQHHVHPQAGNLSYTMIIYDAYSTSPPKNNSSTSTSLFPSFPLSLLPSFPFLSLLPFPLPLPSPSLLLPSFLSFHLPPKSQPPSLNIPSKQTSIHLYYTIHTPNLPFPPPSQKYQQVHAFGKKHKGGNLLTTTTSSSS